MTAQCTAGSGHLLEAAFTCMLANEGHHSRLNVWQDIQETPDIEEGWLQPFTRGHLLSVLETEGN